MPDHQGLATMDMLAAATSREIRALLLVGADPVRDCADPALATDALDAAEIVVAFDAFVTDSSRHADVILPAAVWGEVDGTVTNLEGRVQRMRPSIQPVGQARPLNAVLDDISIRMGVDLRAAKVEDISAEIAATAPTYQGITFDHLTFEAGIGGAVVPLEGATQPLGYIPVEVSVPVITDRMTLHFAESLYDDGVWNRHSPTIASLPRTAVARIHPRDAAVLAVGEGSSVIIDDRYTLPVAIDAQVAVGSIVLPFNHVATKGLAASASVSVDPVRSEA